MREALTTRLEKRREKKNLKRDLGFCAVSV
jgi:hypothetical protein